MRRMVWILWLATIIVGAARPAAPTELQPLMAGWERVFSVDWQSVQYHGQPIVEGYVSNISPYHTTNIRILVEGMDPGGQVLDQRVASIPGDLLGGGRLFFQVPTSAAPSYRVRVFSYDRVEHDGNFR